MRLAVFFFFLILLSSFARLFLLPLWCRFSGSGRQRRGTRVGREDGEEVRAATEGICPSTGFGTSGELAPKLPGSSLVDLKGDSHSSGSRGLVHGNQCAGSLLLVRN